LVFSGIFDLSFLEFHRSELARQYCPFQFGGKIANGMAEARAGLVGIKVSCFAPNSALTEQGA
tara:strand:- start:9731 stop:9919 length:189 start_codon:yes stop_codon:yes gene_type:complete